MLKDVHDSATAPPHFVVVQNWMLEVERLLKTR